MHEWDKDPHDIHTVPDLKHAINRADDNEDRLRIFNRAHYLGLGHYLPAEWNPDGTLREKAST